jgi:hypothetical protein
MMPRRSLGKNHPMELPLTSERMRSPVRSLAHAVFFNIGEERMVTTRWFPAIELICRVFLGQDLWVQRLPSNSKLQDASAL